MKKPLLSATAIASLALCGAQTARAQSIDYGSLQQLFNEPVTTSATGSPMRATEVPVDMTIITADDIKRSGATDLPTILSRVPGIDILNFGAADSDVGVRGYDKPYSSRLLVLINGREVYLDNYGYTAWANLPVQLSEIRQIEVVRGPNSALFGFNAVGGVINIITFNPKYDQTNNIEVHGGSQQDTGASVVQTLHLGDRISMRLSAGGERQQEWSGATQDTRPWNARTMGDIVAQLTPTTELSLDGSYARSSELDYIPVNISVPATYTTSSVTGTVTSDTPYGQIQARAFLNDLVDRYGEFGGGAATNDKNQVEVASVQDLFKLGTQSTIRVAMEYRYNRNNISSYGGGHIDYSVWAPSAMWSYAATSKLSLTAAARVDFYQQARQGLIPPGLSFKDSDWNVSDSPFSVNFGAVYKLTDLDTFRAIYARGVQVPDLLSLGGLQSATPTPFFTLAFVGNPLLKPAVVSNYELSYDRNLPPLSAKISAKIFYQHTDNVEGAQDTNSITFPSSPGLFPYVNAQNVSKSDMAGFELSASGKIDGGFHWSADTTYTNVTDKATGNFFLITRGADFAQTTPKFRGNVAFGWTDTHWSVDAYLHYVTKYDMPLPISPPTLVATPAYVTLAGRIGYQLADGLIVAVSGQNLGADNQVQGQAVGLRAETRGLLSLSKNW